jgi:hypothetical protein
MNESKLAKKMKLPPIGRAAMIQAPPGYLEALMPLPEALQLKQELSDQLDWIQIFVRNQAELEALAPAAVQALGPKGILWISFPKGTSKIQTDLTRDQGWESLEKAGLKWINLISVDETWSAFSLRHFRAGEERTSFR